MPSRRVVATGGVLLLVAAVVVFVRGGAGSSDIGDLDLAATTPSPVPSSAPSSAEDSAVPIEAPVDAASSPAPPARAPSPTVASPVPSPVPSPPQVPEVGVRSGRLADLRGRDPGADPARLRLPTLDLDLPIVPVGVADDGQMEIPDDVDDAGWYRFGPRPGERGNAVVAGHVDDRVQGLGAFRRLVDLAEGDTVEVEAADGTTSAWTVTARRTVDKEALAADDLFARSGPPRLVLVTCGGEFDAERRSYRSNVVVVAERAGGAS